MQSVYDLDEYEDHEKTILQDAAKYQTQWKISMTTNHIQVEQPLNNPLEDYQDVITHADDGISRVLDVPRVLEKQNKTSRYSKEQSLSSSQWGCRLFRNNTGSTK